MMKRKRASDKQSPGFVRQVRQNVRDDRGFVPSSSGGRVRRIKLVE